MRVPGPVVLLASVLLATPSHAALTNAPDYDFTPTPDGYNEVVHPDVVHIPGKLNGFAYWMGITPYHSDNDQSENPCILASNDGRNWTVPAGLTNPLAPAPPFDGYNNDPELIYVNGTLMLYWNETERYAGNETRVKLRTSTNGVNWTAAQTVITATNFPLSPSIVYAGGTYTMWYVYTQSGCGTTPVETVRRRTSTDGVNWSGETTVTLNNSGIRPWHLDVAKDGSKLKMIYVGNQGTGCDYKLYYAESDDGLTWTGSPTPLLTPGAGWDNGFLYRASFIPSGNTLRVWYSARSSAGIWHMGYTETTQLPNAANYLTTPTYDGSGQAAHPDVVHVPGNWNGYAYWMAMTPYTNSNNQVENPSILVSADGLSWSVPPGLTNPLVQPPPGGGLNHNNDPDLLLVGNTMVLYFNQTLTSGVTNVRRMTSTNGVNWSSPQTVITATNYPLTPSVVYANGQYTMWSVYTAIACGSGTEVIQRRTSTDGITWSAASNVTLNGSPAVPWHLDVRYDGFLYRMLYAGYRTGDDCSTLQLYYAESPDGLTWTANPMPVIAPIGQAWDRRMTYRAGFLNTSDQLRVWYSAANMNSPWQWHTGYTTGCIGDCTAPATTTNLAVGTARNGASFSWTAPGDDGTIGTATAYDLRYATFAITEGNFASATQVYTSAPSPTGGIETACVDGLSPCTPYYFALKTVDDRGNWSALSNVVSKSTKCTGAWMICDQWTAMRPGSRETLEEFPLAFEAPRPNPSRDQVTFSFTVPREQEGRDVELSVFDLAGRRMSTVVQGRAAFGRNLASWDLRTRGGGHAAPGTYFARLRVGDRRMLRTLIVAP